MARSPMAPLLDTGDLFPEFRLSLLDGRRLSLPTDLTQPFNVVLVNRGAFCAYCCAQLRAFQTGLPKLTAAGVGVVSFSTDALDDAQKLAREHGLEFPVGFGVSVDTAAERLGVYYEPVRGDRPSHLQSAGFIVRGSGTILCAVYSSGAIGRLVWQDVLGFVEYVKAHE